MKEQATIFFHTRTEVKDVLTLPKDTIETRVFVVDVDEVKQDGDIITTPEKQRAFQEIELFRAANFLVRNNPDLKEKLNLGDYLHIDGCWWCWNDGWIKLASGYAPTRFEDILSKFEDILSNALSEEEETVEEKKRDECCIEIVRASSPTRTGIIMHEGDHLCFDNRCFCFDGMEWTETTGQETSNVLPKKENVMKEEEKNEIKVGRPDTAAELTTLISCYIKALIREKYNEAESTKESDTFRYYLGATLLSKCDEMTVKELRILTYLIAQEVAVEMGTMFGNVLYILKENGIDLYKVADEEKR